MVKEEGALLQALLKYKSLLAGKYSYYFMPVVVRNKDTNKYYALMWNWSVFPIKEAEKYYEFIQWDIRHLETDVAREATLPMVERIGSTVSTVTEDVLNDK